MCLEHSPGALDSWHLVPHLEFILVFSAVEDEALSNLEDVEDVELHVPMACDLLYLFNFGLEIDDWRFCIVQ